MTSTDSPKTTVTVPARQFAAALRGAMCFAGTDDTLPMLAGVEIRRDGDRVQLSATDRINLEREHAETTKRDRLIEQAARVMLGDDSWAETDAAGRADTLWEAAALYDAGMLREAVTE